METCTLSEQWNLFHISCMSFYLLYGFLNAFLYKTYSKNVYFRHRWLYFHEQDKILEYFTFGTGKIYLIMGVLVGFCNYSLDPTITVNTDLQFITKLYTLFQIKCWLIWLLTEFYYTYNGIEWPVIGIIHTILSGTVLYQAVNLYTSVDLIP